MKVYINITLVYLLLKIGYAFQSEISEDNVCESEGKSLSDADNYSTRNIQGQFSEDGLLNFTGLAKKYIKPAEEYDVTTEDGYILKLFHIKGNSSRAVLVCHGILSSSDDFLIRGKTSLIYMLARKGFDVWVMNCRGNRYSRKHVKLNPDKDRQFWQYSMHEVGVYDYKAIVDFILKKTGVKQLSVVAHSEGTTGFFIFVSERPEYNSYIKVFVGLAPITILENSGFGLTLVLKLSPITSLVQSIFHSEEFLGYYSNAKNFINKLCTQGTIGYRICFNILGSLTGFDSNNIEQELASTIIGHFPAGTSRKTLAHYGFNYYAHRFEQYDYGVKNFLVYRSLRPPPYNLTKVTTKAALFAGQGDLVDGLEDAKRIRSNLPNVLHFQVINDTKFNHIDFMWGRNAHEVCYKYVIQILSKYNK